MRRQDLTGFLARVAAGLAAVGLCIPQVALAATPTNHRTPLVSDVQLREGGVLLGPLVTPQNIGVAEAQVALSSGEQQLAVGKTDQHGYFAFAGLRNGLYQVTAADGYGTYRVWTATTAPPAAQPGVLIVGSQGTVRGQYGMRRMRDLLANPWVVAGIVATAVAVPVAVSNADTEPATP